MLIFDLESDGFLRVMTKIHCLHILDTATGKEYRFDNQAVHEGVKMLHDQEVCGHNIIKFDIPAIQKIFPGFRVKKAWDTLIWAQLQYPNLIDGDIKRVQAGTMPRDCIKKHSLKAYGYRMGILKGTFGETTDWKEWSQGMSDYCWQDVLVTLALYEKLSKAGTSPQALELELKVATIISRQERHGFKFNRKKAVDLYAQLSQRRDELKEELQRVFRPWYKKGKEFTPKANNKRHGYVAGASMTKIKLTEFNPASRFHIADRLQKLFGWVPKEFTDDGQPKVDEDVLSKLHWPEAKLLSEYFVVQKRIGQLAEGDEDKAWLAVVEEGERIYGSVNSLGAVTRRMTHSFPNMAQVPACGKPYGAECRDLFFVDDGHVLVGADASGLELRCLAHFMGAFDGGAYAEIVLNGDIHTANQQAANLPTRNAAKRFIYAFLYGAGNELLGVLVSDEGANYSRQKFRQIGGKVKKKFMEGLPALNKLITAVQGRIKDGQQIRSLDGQPLHCRSAHSALNLLLQSAGALIMKQALVILDEDLQAAGFVPGVDYEFCANIHDEWQIEVFDPANADTVGRMACLAITKAGEHFKFRCRLDGEYKVGWSWKETH